MFIVFFGVVVDVNDELVDFVVWDFFFEGMGMIFCGVMFFGI